jgi:DNA-binding response OmpR family regulator
MNNIKILIIEDELSICDILSYKLKKEKYIVRYCTSGKEGLKQVESFKPNLILLDIMLPDMSGFDICKNITVNYNIPIIMLTARNDITDKLIGLELGADDYITKPFDIREVAARIKVVLRRMESLPVVDNDIICLNNNIRINISSRKIYKDNIEIKLKPKEFDLLIMMCRNKNIVFTREQLLDRVGEWTLKVVLEL